MKTIVVNKKLTDEDVRKLEGSRLPKGFYETVIDEDADVYTADGNLLLRFRKNVLSGVKIDLAYDNLIDFAKKKTSTRGMASGNPDKPKITGYNERIMSNIMGYFDTTSVKQKSILKKAGMPVPKCRMTSFTGKFPDKWKNVIPLIEEIDEQYKLLCPTNYAKQYDQAIKTKYQIADTAFTTITTNVNLQTAVHKDKGDYKQGFGNLVVIERGEYNGGFTGFPQYGVAVNVRQGDYLAMDVHQYHGNEPIEGKDDFVRFSIVSYLREGIVKKCVGEEILGEEYFRKASKIVSEMKN
jgi:hypothetical protein